MNDSVWLLQGYYTNKCAEAYHPLFNTSDLPFFSDFECSDLLGLAQGALEQIVMVIFAD